MLHFINYKWDWTTFLCYICCVHFLGIFGDFNILFYIKDILQLCICNYSISFLLILWIYLKHYFKDNHKTFEKIENRNIIYNHIALAQSFVWFCIWRQTFLHNCNQFRIFYWRRRCLIFTWLNMWSFPSFISLLCRKFFPRVSPKSTHIFF